MQTEEGLDQKIEERIEENRQDKDYFSGK